MYSGVTDIDAFGTKSQAEDYMDFQEDEGSDFNILDKSDIEDIQLDPGFQQAVSDIICSELSKNGFQICQQERASTPNIEGSAPAVSNSEPNSEGDDNEGNDNNDEDDEEGDGNEDGDNEENLFFD